VRSPLLRLQGDERLIALMRRGNEAAFEVLFDRYRPRLLAFCRQMLHSTEDAEDVLQEVFVAAYRAILSDEREIAARPWLYRIARNRCLNHLRRPVADADEAMDERPFEHGATTLEKVQKREDFRNLIEDVGELPETQRTALLLRELDALSYEEIGAAMDTTVPSVKSLLVRARMSLAEASEARLLSCNEVRVALAESTEGIGRVSGPARRHVRGCEECKRFRMQLRSDTKALAALFPGPLIVLKGILLGKLGAASGSAGAAGGSAGGIGGGFGGGISGALGGALATKATAGVVTAALLTAGAVEIKRESHHSASSPSTHAAVAPAPTPPPHHFAVSAHPKTAAVGPAEPKRPAKPQQTASADAAAPATHETAPTQPASTQPTSGSGNGNGNGGWSTSPDGSGAAGPPSGGGTASGSSDPGTTGTTSSVDPTAGTGEGTDPAAGTGTGSSATDATVVAPVASASAASR
jgi:RNA polymerase sigma factor (sigma-70 family)